MNKAWFAQSGALIVSSFDSKYTLSCLMKQINCTTFQWALHPSESRCLVTKLKIYIKENIKIRLY